MNAAPATKQTTKMTPEEAVANVRAALAEVLGEAIEDMRAVVGTGIRDHDEPFVAKPRNMTNAQLADLASKKAAEEKEIHPYTQRFEYRPWDMAIAFQNVYERTFGHLPVSRKGSFFEPGSQTIEVKVGRRKTISVPFGSHDLPPFEGKVLIYGDDDAKLGQVGMLTFEVPKRGDILASVKGFCQLVEKELQENSIYKGKAITSEDMPSFLNPYATDKSEIIWSRSLDAGLRGSLLNLIRYTDRARSRGHRLHRSVLFLGEPGNGKTETLNIVAQDCEANEWTFVLATTNLTSALQTARLHTPAVVAIEDFERLIKEATPQERAMLLEELDGSTSKDRDIILIATTNFPKDLDQATRRRMAMELEFGGFDVPAAERFLRNQLNGQGATDAGNTTVDPVEHLGEYSEAQRTQLDYAEVAKKLEGWPNAYVAKVTSFANGLALEHEHPQITTADMLDAVAALEPGFHAFRESDLRPTPNRFDMAFKDVLAEAMNEKLDLQIPALGATGEFVMKG